MRTARLNPFHPSQPVADAGAFAGRDAQLHVIKEVISQAADGTPRHGFITGPPGVGKSSLALACMGLARGDPGFLRLLPEPQLFGAPMLTGLHHVQAGEDLADLVRMVDSELGRRTSLALGLRVDAELNVGIAKVHIQKDVPEQLQSATTMVRVVLQYWRKVRSQMRGILLILDDFDQIADQAGVASFLKAVTEDLAVDEGRNVALLLAGQQGSLERLKEQHPSVGRLFTTIPLTPFAPVEARELIDKTLFGTGMNIGSRARQSVIEAADGMPWRLQLIGYESFSVAERAGEDRIQPRHVLASIAALAERGELSAEVASGASP